MKSSIRPVLVNCQPTLHLNWVKASSHLESHHRPLAVLMNWEIVFSIKSLRPQIAGFVLLAVQMFGIFSHTSVSWLICWLVSPPLWPRLIHLLDGLPFCTQNCTWYPCCLANKRWGPICWVFIANNRSFHISSEISPKFLDRLAPNLVQISLSGWILVTWWRLKELICRI